MTSATNPRQQFERDLSSQYGLVGSTVYRKKDNYAFSEPQPFLSEVGASDFNGLKFDTGYNPASYKAPAPAPTQTPAQASTPAQNSSPAPSPALPVAASDDKDAYIRGLAQNYFTSLQPSAALTSAKQNYQDFISSRDSGILAQEGQGRGRVLPVIRGDQERLMRQSELTANRLQGEIGIQQEAQGQAAAAAQARLQFEQGIAERDYERSEALRKEQSAQQEQLRREQLAQQESARQFAYENNITTPFYEIGGTIYRTSDNKAYSTPEQFFADGGARDWSNVKKVVNRPKPIEISQGASLVDPTTGKVLYSAPEDPLDSQMKALQIQKLIDEINGRGDLLPTEKDRAAFNQIVNKFSASPLIAASDRTIVLQNTVNAIKNDPANAAMQLNLAYGYIQALDTYQSAVREGELANVNTIDSKIGQLQNYVQQMTSGQTVRPEVAMQLAGAAQNLVDYITEK